MYADIVFQNTFLRVMIFVISVNISATVDKNYVSSAVSLDEVCYS